MQRQRERLLFSKNNTNINIRFIQVVLNLFHRTLSDRFVLIITTFYLPKARMVLYYFYEPHSYCSSPLKILPRHIESNVIAHPPRPTAASKLKAVVAALSHGQFPTCWNSTNGTHCCLQATISLGA